MKGTKVPSEISSDHPFIGTWITDDEDSDPAFRIKVVGGKFRVSGFCRSDGEAFEISGVKWDGQGLCF
jgi:hypothetical protein